MPFSRKDLQALKTLIEETLDERFDHFERKHVDRYDEMITKLDKAIGELKDAREFQEIHGQKHQDINDKLSTIEDKLSLVS